mmetsp:Transcript_65134/g.194170  ORF Transcript_65134/g.194170 Transcript_65134/m.194170 type:complete len:363 (+) Transcript_65134:389-1477(+)
MRVHASEARGAGAAVAASGTHSEALPLLGILLSVQPVVHVVGTAGNTRGALQQPPVGGRHVLAHIHPPGERPRRCVQCDHRALRQEGVADKGREGQAANDVHHSLVQSLLLAEMFRLDEGPILATVPGRRLLGADPVHLQSLRDRRPRDQGLHGLPPIRVPAIRLHVAHSVLPADDEGVTTHDHSAQADGLHEVLAPVSCLHRLEAGAEVVPVAHARAEAEADLAWQGRVVRWVQNAVVPVHQHLPRALHVFHIVVVHGDAAHLDLLPVTRNHREGRCLDRLRYSTQGCRLRLRDLRLAWLICLGHRLALREVLIRTLAARFLQLRAHRLDRLARHGRAALRGVLIRAFAAELLGHLATGRF